MFDIPVALFLFRRSETLPAIISRIREVRPSKKYLLADEGRTDHLGELFFGFSGHKARKVYQKIVNRLNK